MATLTQRLGGMFRRVRSDEPVQIMVRRSVDDAAESLQQLAEGHANGHLENGNGHGGNGNGNGRHGLFSRLPGARRDVAIQQLQRGYDEMIELMRTMREHMHQQSERSERLLVMIQRTTDSLGSLPQHAANQAALIENIGANLESQARQSRALNEALSNLARAGEHQGEVLGLIHKQISNSREADGQMLASLTGMNQTLTTLSATNQASALALRQVTDQSSRADERMAEILSRNQKQMTLMVVTSWIVAAVALGVAAYAVFKL